MTLEDIRLWDLNTADRMILENRFGQRMKLLFII